MSMKNMNGLKSKPKMKNPTHRKLNKLLLIFYNQLFII